MTMKIVEILEAAEGGTRTHLDYILNGLHKEFDFHFIYSLERNPGYQKDIDRYKELGISCYEVPMKRSVSLFKDDQSAQEISSLLNRIKPDIVHAHSSKAGYLARRIRRPTHTKLVYTPHCLYFPSRQGIKRLIYKWGEQLYEHKTDLYIAVSEDEKLNLAEHITSEEKVKRIDNGVPLVSVPSPEQREKMVLFPARAARQKGWEFFIETAHQVHEQDKEAVFVFAGSGEELDTIRGRIRQLSMQEFIRLPGHVEDMASQYTKASVVAVTSRWEGEPYSILEAFSYACPVAAFDIPGVNELITPDKDGYLIPPFNCTEMAEKITALLQDPAKTREMGEKGREKIEKHYSLDRFLKEMQELYRGI
jgi:glycosyltransferase involved in cell wall biosynthesis